MNIKSNIKTVLMALAAVMMLGTMNSCSDEPDKENFYTFTGEMMSDYLNNRESFSEFRAIVERAGLMDLLASYGHYTCFAPTNEAIEAYLAENGLSSIDQLTDEDCDTIARTHLVNNLYSTYEMSQDRLQTANFLGRYIATEQMTDDEDNAIVLLEGTTKTIFGKTYPNGDYIHQNDSVENGIVHPVDMVIEKSNSLISDLLRVNPKVSVFYKALVATGVINEIQGVSDENYDPSKYVREYYKSHEWNEVASVPDKKNIGYTVFAEPNEVYLKKFEDEGITIVNKDTLKALYDLACIYYDNNENYSGDKGKHSYDNLKADNNALKRFMQYHILNRQVAGTADLTPIVMDKTGEAFGIATTVVNPVDWYATLLPHTMVKIEQLTVRYDKEGRNNKGNGTIGERYINRRYCEPDYQFEGAHIDATVEKKPIHDGLNGHYFYIDDVLAFSQDVLEKVQNMRIRMDFSSIFPEVMTNGMRQEGNPYTDDSKDTPDDSSTPKNGRNFYFPLGYLDGVDFNSNCLFVLRRPHTNFWSWQGDEWNLFGDYDLTLRIPPVPFSGEWQFRLGFCAIPTRGVMQVYFGSDPKNLTPQGIPLDMTKFLNDEMYLGSRFKSDEKLNDYNGMTDLEKAQEQKVLKNLKAYRAGTSTYHFNPSTGEKFYFAGNERTYRRVLCTAQVDCTKDYYIRFRVASDGKQGNNNEFMLDYFEMVPRSVYSVDGDGDMEDDL